MNINIITRILCRAFGGAGVALSAGVGVWAGCVDAGDGDVGDVEVPTAIAEDPSDNPLRDLTAVEQRLFDAGDAAFEARFHPAQGLGPLYIRASCAACHADDAKGPGFVEKAVVLDEAGQIVLDATPFGPTLRPFFAPPATQPLAAPEGAGVFRSSRTGPAVFGRGYIEAIRDDEIERVAAEQAARGDGVSGRVHRVRYNSKSNPDTTYHNHTEGEEGLIGRFGLKARIATLDEFTADAFVGDMGLTSPLRPAELPNPDGVSDDAKAGVDVDVDTVNAVAVYMRLLALPRRADVAVDPKRQEGQALFSSVGCAVCHVESLRTRADYPIAALRDVDAAVFSDLLLHDMGEGLKDGVVDGDAASGASGREWKTAPLIGLRFFRGFLHDSRADSVAEAVEAHGSAGSEANDAVARYRALSVDERDALVAFVEGL